MKKQIEIHSTQYLIIYLQDAKKKKKKGNYKLVRQEEITGEGNGTPLQSSCLENPVDGGAWWAAVHGVAKSRTRLSNFTFTFMHWRRKWQPTPVFSPGESQGRGSLGGCRLWGRTESDTAQVTQQHLSRRKLHQNVM